MKNKQSKLEYYQELNCHSYYSEGNLVNLKAPVVLFMVSLTESGMYCVTKMELAVMDVLMVNIYVEGLPFEKLMAKVQSVKKIGDYFKVEFEFMGMPNALFHKIHELMGENPKEKSLTLSQEEIQLLSGIVKRLKT